MRVVVFCLIILAFSQSRMHGGMRVNVGVDKKQVE